MAGRGGRGNQYVKGQQSNPFADIAKGIRNQVATAVDPWDGADEMATYLGRLYIRTKKMRLARFELNAVQRDMLEKIETLPKDRPRKVLVLKARQMGMSTCIQGLAYALMRTREYAKAVTVSHEADATERLHSMQSMFLENDITKPVTKRNRIGSLEFSDTKTSHYVGTAGSRTFGRGDTVNFIHASEVAFWPDAETLIVGLGEALAAENGLEFLESTPNGVGGYFYELWQGAPDNGFLPLFYAWWWDPSYRLPIADLSLFLPLKKDEQELMAEHGLDNEQIAWRREKQKALKEKFLQEYPEDPESCFLSSGMPYFDSEMLKRILARDVREPLTHEMGLSIWVGPDKAATYVVSSDTAEGLEGGDYSVSEVIDVRTGEQVAELRGQWPIAYFTEKTRDLAILYNGAMIAPERNNHGHAFINHLLNVLKYENIYVHEEYDLRRDEVRKQHGYPTNQVTKPVMLSDLSAAINAKIFTVHSRLLANELRTMAWNGKGGVEATSGCHDDTVMAAAIAWQAKKMPARFQTALDYLEQSAKQRSVRYCRDCYSDREADQAVCPKCGSLAPSIDDNVLPLPKREAS